MFKFIIDNKKFLFPVAALFLSLLILISEVYAWFFVSKETETSTFAMGVINFDEKISDIEVEVVGGNGGLSEMIIPGNSLFLTFSVTNYDKIKNTYLLCLSNYNQTYPNNNLTEPLLDYDVYSVINSVETNIDFDEEELSNPGFKDAFYSNFRTPISNALSYRMYESSVINKGDYSFFSSKVNGNTIINDILKSFTLEANETKTFSFEIWFNPAYYPTAMVNGINYIIKNSNSFSGQSFQISLGVRKQL